MDIVRGDGGGVGVMEALCQGLEEQRCARCATRWQLCVVCAVMAASPTSISTAVPSARKLPLNRIYAVGCTSEG